MSKRNRSNPRFEGMRSLVIISNENDWPREQTVRELEKLINKNADLHDEKAKGTFRSEFWTVSDAHRKVPLSKIIDLAQKIMDAEPPGTSKRFYHVFVDICRHVQKTGNLP